MQHFSWARAGVLAVRDHEFAIDQHSVHANRILMRLLKCRFVYYAVRIENRYVCEIAFDQ